MHEATNFAELMREHRKARDLTQERLAHKVGCATVTLKKIEAGKLRPSRQIAERLAEALGLPLAQRHSFVQLARGAGEVPLSEQVAGRIIGNPYRGLHAFQEQDAALFFGRKALTQRLLQRLAQNRSFFRFLAIVGPSGSGKSSIVRAGLLPLLRQGGLPHSEHWLIADMVPGTYPFEALEAALLLCLQAASPHLAGRINLHQTSVARMVQRILPDDPQIELVVLIDQFEELFTLVHTERERTTFLQQIVEAITTLHSRLRVIITLRADFLAQPLLYSGFAELIQQRCEIITPLSAAELEQAITQPAALANTVVESGLVATLVRDVQAQPGALPLLQYTLTQLFQQQSTGLLKLADYEATGSIAGSLARQAEAVFASLTPTERMHARQIFMRLVQPGETNVDFRRRIKLTEFGNALAVFEPILALFAKARLLTFDQEIPDHTATVEVAHEALIQTWDRLRHWIDQSRDVLRLHRYLVSAIAEWETNKCATDFLSQGARLSQFEELLHDAAVLTLNSKEQAFLEASIAERNRQLAQAAAVQAQLRENLARSEAQRLAAEANNLLHQEGNVELIALLAIHSLQLVYTPQADEALIGASLLDYPIQQYLGHTSRIYAVAYASDGKTILTAAQDTTIRWWDVASGACLQVLIGHTNIINSVVFLPDGVQCVSASIDGSVHIWQLARGKVSATPFTCADGVVDVACSPDGEWLAVVPNKIAPRLINIHTGQERLLERNRQRRVLRIAWSPDGTLIAISEEGCAIELWDAQTCTIRIVQRISGVGDAISFSPNSQYLGVGCTDRRILILHSLSGSCVQILVGHTDLIRSLSFSADSSIVLSGSTDSTARLWDTTSGRELRRFVSHSNYVFGTAFSPDEQYILIGSADHTARLWYKEIRGYLPILRGHTTDVAGVAFSADGKYIATGGDDTTIRLWDAKTGIEIHTFRGHAQAIIAGSVAYAPNGRYLLSGSLDYTAKIWDIERRQELHTLLGHTGYLWGVAFAPDSQRCVTAGHDRTIRLWDVTTGGEIRQFLGHTNQVVGVNFSPDGALIVSGADDGTARIWNVATGTELCCFRDPDGPILGVAFSPDGENIVAACASGMVREWQVASAQMVQEYFGHTGHVWSVVYTPDSKYVVSGGIDRTARLWDRATGTEIRRFVGHRAAILSVTCSPDSRHILTGSIDGTARIWDIDYRTTMAYLRSRLLRDFTNHERVQYNIT
jgi:WD40 repeat protein/transcriptional regulator with XRE-family HTH domain